MGQMFDKTCDQMNNCRWDNPCAFGDQVDHSNPQTTSSWKVIHTTEHFSWYGSPDLWAKIEPPSRQQYKPGDFLAVRPVSWDEIIDEDDDDENWVDRAALCGGSSRPGDGNDNDDDKGEEDTQGRGIRNRKRMEVMNRKGKREATKDGKGKGKATEGGKRKGKGNGTGKGKGIVKRPPGGESSLSSGKATGSKGNGARRANKSGYIPSRKYRPLWQSP